MFLRPDDGITGKLPVTCENGHDGMQAPMPANLASVSANSFSIEAPYPLCGGKLSAPAGYYVRNEDGVFERLSGMPS
jgi:hypothetical protein